MAIHDRIKFEIELNSNTIDVTSYVREAAADRGRHTALDENGPGSATLLLHDPDRDFDPFNTGTRTIDGDNFDADDLVQGCAVTISIRPSDSDPWAIRWTGEVADWQPTTWEGDGTDTNPAVIVPCVGRVGNLNRVLTPTAGDLLADKIRGASAACWYTFASNTNDPTGDGRVQDFSGRSADGIAFTDEPNDTTGWVLGANSNQWMQYGSVAGSYALRTPLPGDSLRNASGGWIVAAEIQPEATTGLASNRNEDIWVIASDGTDGSGEPADGWVLYLVEDRNTTTATTTLDTNDMAIELRIYASDGASSNPQYMVNTLTAGTGDITGWDVGTRDDWLDHERMVLFGCDAGGLWLEVISLDGVDVDSSSRLSFSGTWSLHSVRARPPHDFPDTVDPFISRFGQGFFNTSPLANATWGYSGELGTAALVHAGASPDWGDMFADLVETEGGLSVPSAGDRIDTMIADIGFASADFTKDITSGILYAHPPNLGRATALDRINQLCLNEQGRLCQKAGGDVEFDDFDAAKTQCAVSGSEPTYSDQGGVGDLPYLDAGLSTGRDQIINRCTVRLPASGHQYTKNDATSQTAHGIRSVSYDLIIADNDTADDFADAIVARFKDQQKHVAWIIVDPKTDSGWWDELDTRDIGDRVNVERQPAGTGTVTSVASVIEGESWTWSAKDDRLLFTFHFSPAAFYDGVTYP